MAEFDSEQRCYKTAFLFALSNDLIWHESNIYFVCFMVMLSYGWTTKQNSDNNSEALLQRNDVLDMMLFLFGLCAELEHLRTNKVTHSGEP